MLPLTGVMCASLALQVTWWLTICCGRGRRALQIVTLQLSRPTAADCINRDGACVCWLLLQVTWWHTTCCGWGSKAQQVFTRQLSLYAAADGSYMCITCVAGDMVAHDLFWWAHRAPQVLTAAHGS
jgi:hypothetical protein